MTSRATRRQMMAAAAAGCGAILLAIRRSGAGEPSVYTGIVTGVALGGYDPVSYFSDGRPIAGSPQHSMSWRNAEWRFASAANLARFRAAPERYAPRYGGYCAWAVAEGYTAHGDPHIWAIVGERLYLNYSRRIHRRWEADVPGFVARADANWPAVLGR